MTSAQIRGLLLLVSVVILSDTVLFSAITPLLPDFADEHDLSDAQAGLISAAYPAGVLLASLPASAFAARVGVRVAVVIGMLALALASVAFAFADSGTVLGLTRLAQGFGSAVSWAGALGWLADTAPRERRAELIGTAFGAAIGGALIGPALGGLAQWAGQELVFGAFAAVGLGAAVACLLAPAPGDPAPAIPFRDIVRRSNEPRIVVGLWLTALLGMTFGTLNTLAPLRLDELGAGAAVIAGTFLVAAGLEALAAPLGGRLTDRRGAFAPVFASLPIGAAILVVAGAPTATWQLVLVVLALGPAIGVMWSPAAALITDGADSRLIPTVWGFAVLNVGWGIGQTAGASGGAALAEATALVVPFALLAVVYVGTLLVLRRAPVARPGSAAALGQ